MVHGAQHRQQQGGGNAAGHIQGQVQKTTVHKPPAFHGGAKDFDAPAEEGVEQQIEKQVENGVGNLHGGHSCLFLLGSFRLHSIMQSKFVKGKKLGGTGFFTPWSYRRFSYRTSRKFLIKTD